MKLAFFHYGAIRASQYRRWHACNEELETGIGGSKSWQDLDVDENYIDWETSWGKFEEIEAVVLAAKAGKEKNSKATLWHWAARCNKTWVIFRFLNDPIACESLMLLDGQDNTALQVAIDCGSTAVAKILQTHITKNNLVTINAVASSIATPNIPLLFARSMTSPALVSGQSVLKNYAAGALRETKSMTGHSNSVFCITLLPDGRLASGSLDKTIKIWDVASNRCEATLTGHSYSVECLTLLPDGRLASGSLDNTIKIWDMASNRCEATLKGHSRIVKCLRQLPDGRLASGSEDKTIKIWDVASNRCEASLTGHSYWVSCLTLLPDGRLASGSYDATIKIWDVVRNRCDATLTGHSRTVCCLTVLPDGRLASGSCDATIKIWDVASNSCEATLEGHSSTVYYLTLLPDGRLISGSMDSKIKIWDVANNRCDATLTEHTDWVRCLTMLPDGRLASGSDDKTIKIWDFPTLSPATLLSLAAAVVKRGCANIIASDVLTSNSDVISSSSGNSERDAAVSPTVRLAGRQLFFQPSPEEPTQRPTVTQPFQSKLSR